MGKYASSIKAVGPDEYHHYFVYYLPGRGLSFTWIDRYFTDNLADIASRIGPEGLMITPTRQAVNDYSAELLARVIELGVPTKSQRALQSGLPFLIVSRWPIHTEMCLDRGIRGWPNFLAINLAYVHDEAEMASLLDSMILGIHSNSDLLMEIGKGLSFQVNILGIAVDLDPVFSSVKRIVEGRKRRRIRGITGGQMMGDRRKIKTKSQ